MSTSREVVQVCEPFRQAAIGDTREWTVELIGVVEIQVEVQSDFCQDDATRNCAGIRSKARTQVKVQAGSEIVTKDFDGIELMKATELPKEEPAVTGHLITADFVPGLVWVGVIKVPVGDETWRFSLSLNASSETVWVSARVDEMSTLRVSLQALPTSISRN